MKLQSWQAIAPRLARVLTVALAAALLFVHCVQGERAAGDCPRDEVCSDATPEGLLFLGPTFYDETAAQLGPIIEGGTFTVRLSNLSGGPLPAFEVVSSNPKVLSAIRVGPAGPNGEAPVDIELKGLQVGSAKLRVLEAATGLLLDRLEVDVFKVHGVKLHAVNGGDGVPYRGCAQMIGIDLVVARDGGTVRAFDQSVQLRVAGADLKPEAEIWDCFVHDVPENAASVTYEVVAGGKILTASLPTRQLADDELSACPPVQLD